MCNQWEELIVQLFNTIYDTAKGLYILCEIAYVLIVWVSIPCQLYHLLLVKQVLFNTLIFIYIIATYENTCILRVSNMAVVLQF